MPSKRFNGFVMSKDSKLPVAISKNALCTVTVLPFMFKFFTEPKWYVWAYVGSVVILTSIWVQVQILSLIHI